MHPISRFPIVALVALISLAVLAAILTVSPDGGHAVRLLFDPAAGLASIAIVGEVAQAMPWTKAWRRARDEPFTMENVPASGTGKATGKIPRYDQTLLQILLVLGGTTFTKAMITAIRLKLGQTTISSFTAAHLQKMNDHFNRYSHDNYLVIDFTNPEQKVALGEYPGAWDLSSFPRNRGDITIEVDIAGATAPSLKALAVWAPPQGGNDVIKRIVPFAGAFSVSGSSPNSLYLDFDGMDLARLFCIYAGNDICGTSATAAAWTGNTGDGVFGAVTVSSGAQVGTHKFVCVEPGTNVGTFAHELPDGTLNSKRMVVAAAYSSAGLAFTLADGSTDFLSGDGFDVPVGKTSDGNINRLVVKKNGEPIWDRTCNQARFEQRYYGYKPQSQMLVADFVLDKRSPDGLIVTRDAQQVRLDYFATATDTYTIYAEGYQKASSLKGV